ncbi:cell division protein ZapA [Qipengyuania sp. NPDC077410]|uniref:cell division protein ZapA n=1 Tax=Qipengyuania sp. NPDC077410 TaxID=3364496 RepID=UPI0037CBAE14
MSDVTLSIGGRNYTVSCADGQEDHVRHLAGVIDGKLSAMGNNLSSNDAKNLLFAALILADEVEEARDRPLPATEPGFDTDRLGNQLERMAIALENAASTLEGSGSTS